MGHEGVQVAIPIQVAQGHITAHPSTNILNVTEITSPIVMPDIIWLVANIGYVGVQVTIPIQITQAEGKTVIRICETTSKAEVSKAVIEPPLVILGKIYNQSIQVAITIQVAQVHIYAILISFRICEKWG